MAEAKKKPVPVQLLPENKSPKATQVEMEQRVNYVLELILEAHRPSEILRLVAERYKISYRSCEELWARAKQRMIENNRQTIEESAAEISAHYWDIINQTKKVKEFSTSISALKEVSKLKGLDQVTVNHNINVKEFDNMPDDAIDAYFEKKKDE